MKNIANYTEQIQEIANFAKANNLNPDTDMDAIMSGWSQMAYNRHKAIEANKSKAIEIIKTLL